MESTWVAAALNFKNFNNSFKSLNLELKVNFFFSDFSVVTRLTRMERDVVFFLLWISGCFFFLEVRKQWIVDLCLVKHNRSVSRIRCSFVTKFENKLNFSSNAVHRLLRSILIYYTYLLWVFISGICLKHDYIKFNYIGTLIQL